MKLEYTVFKLEKHEIEITDDKILQEIVNDDTARFDLYEPTMDLIEKYTGYPVELFSYEPNSITDIWEAETGKRLF